MLTTQRFELDFKEPGLLIVVFRSNYRCFLLREPTIIHVHFHWLKHRNNVLRNAKHFFITVEQLVQYVSRYRSFASVRDAGHCFCRTHVVGHCALFQASVGLGIWKTLHSENLSDVVILARR